MKKKKEKKKKKKEKKKRKEHKEKRERERVYTIGKTNHRTTNCSVICIRLRVLSHLYERNTHYATNAHEPTRFCSTLHHK